MVVIAYFIIIGIALGYVFLILNILHGWDKIETPENQDINKSNIGISVIIAARNEEKYIVECVQSILSNKPTSSYEIIIVNDHSTDRTLQRLNSLNDKKLTIMDLPDGISGKKAAISFAIDMAKYDLILCTDADSRVGNKWIQSHLNFQTAYSHNIQTSLVIPEDTDSYLSRFQIMDFVATMAITANGIKRKQYFLANGANLCYKKSFFYGVNGFAGNQKIASGDDVFLMEKAVSIDINKVGFLKSIEAMVITKSEESWKAFFNQRKRWASKSMKTSDLNVKKIQGFIFLFCLILLLSILVSPIFIPEILFAGLTALCIKLVIDYVFLYKLTIYFKQEQVMKSFVPVFFIYFFHILYSGIIALFPTTYEWKERNNQ